MHIYKFTHLASGRCYIGQTIQDPNRRRLEHIADSKHTPRTYHFHNALKKYGVDSFTFEIIATATTLEELNTLEETFIQQFDSITNGFNIRAGGGNKTHHPDSIKRMSEAQKVARIHRKNNGTDCGWKRKDGGPMKGKVHPNKGKSCANKGKKKGMTWEEIYGIEGAAQRRQHRTMLALSRKSGG
jgi:group I intron endonuclease